MESHQTHLEWTFGRQNKSVIKNVSDPTEALKSQLCLNYLFSTFCELYLNREMLTITSN